MCDWPRKGQADLPVEVRSSEGLGVTGPLSQACKARSNYFLEELYATGEGRPVFCLLFFSQAAFTHQCGKCRDVSGKEDWVVEQLFMALVAEDRGPTFKLPWTLRKDAGSFGALSVRGPSEEALGDKVMRRRVASALGVVPRVCARRAMEPALTDRAPLV